MQPRQFSFQKRQSHKQLEQMKLTTKAKQQHLKGLQHICLAFQSFVVKLHFRKLKRCQSVVTDFVII